LFLYQWCIAVHGSGWYAQHSIDPEAELEDVELLGATDLPPADRLKILEQNL
jgi:hypothetical protein